VRRTIVAIDTVHAPFLSCGDLFSAERPTPIRVFSHIAIPIFNTNPGNNLPLLIGGYKRDLIRQIHVPVDAGNWSTRRIATAYVNQHARLA
jgi:hypothetical protein